MAEHEQHSSFIKTPQQLLTVVLLAFVVPIFGIVMLVHLVTQRPHADPGALTDKAVAARVGPVAKVEIGAPPAAPGARSGEEIVKTVCGACHVPGVAGAPKIGDKAAWAPHIKMGLNAMVATAAKGTAKGMPPRGGAADLTDQELARAIVHMANQSGGSLKEPAAPAAAKPEAKKK
jgi:cytochrome c5